MVPVVTIWRNIFWKIIKVLVYTVLPGHAQVIVFKKMTKSKLSQQLAVDNLKIGSHVYSSRLIVGTGKYPSEDIASNAINSSGAELVTLAIKRFSQQDARSNILEVIGNKKLLPNTAGTLNAKEALRSAQLSRELFKTNLILLQSNI